MSALKRGNLPFWLLIFLLLAGMPGCEKQPSSENITPPRQGSSLPPADEQGEESSHPGTGVMAEINTFKERLKANPKDLEALIFLGNSNFDIRRYEKAREMYLQALSIDPKNPSVRTDLATCYRNLGQQDQAIVELRTVLALTPQHPPALYNLGIILLNDKGDEKGALQVWQQLLDSHPGHQLSRGLAEKINKLKSQKGENPL